MTNKTPTEADLNALDITPGEAAEINAISHPLLAGAAPDGNDDLVRIEATTDGAVGKQYLVAVDIGESGQPSSIFLGGHYEDVYAKTPEGWRFNTRTFIASATGAEAK